MGRYEASLRFLQSGALDSVNWESQIREQGYQFFLPRWAASAS